MAVEKLSPERLVYLSSLLTLSLSGLGVIAITSYTKVNKSSVQLSLTRALWKFESEENKKTIYLEKCWAWRKLVLAGIMIASLVSSILAKFYGPVVSLGAAGAVYSLWLVGLTGYWYVAIAPAFSMKGKPQLSEQSQLSGKGTATNPAVEAWMARKLDKEGMTDSRLPLTIVTGFLGSGKTTLVKNILQNTVGMKVLVIENEIGAEGIDHELLMQHTAKEEIILMNNGCICCTVRKDLLTTFHRMFAHEAFAQLDWVVIETTGMADPAPLIQSVYMDAECQARLRLDSVLTVVDCKHLPNHLRTPPNRCAEGTNSSSTTAEPNEGGLAGIFRITSSNPAGSSASAQLPEAVLQITFADRVLLNKTDLVTEAELADVVQSVQRINPNAMLIACQNSLVPIEELLNIRAFDPLQNKALLSDEAGFAVGAEGAPVFAQVCADGKTLKRLDKASAASKGSGSKGKKLKLSAEGAKIRSKHTVNTVSLVCEKPLDLDLFNEWVSKLLADKGADIYRIKGILWMDGYEEQFVVHGVHMIFDGRRGRTWTEAAASLGVEHVRRYSRLVFIGLGIERESLESGFFACCAK